MVGAVGILGQLRRLKTWDHQAVSVDRPQKLRVLEGRFTLERATDALEVAAEAELLALVFGPDGTYDGTARRHSGQCMGRAVEW